MKPRFAIVQVGEFSYVFLDGRLISSGIKDITYHAKNENGKLEPTIDMKINLQDFSFKEGITVEEFLKEMKMLEENSEKNNPPT